VKGVGKEGPAYGGVNLLRAWGASRRGAYVQANAPAEARCQASPPAGCSAADDEGRVPCPDCGKLVRVTNRIDGLYVCIDCWERSKRGAGKVVGDDA